jgi:hypothetical protein
VRAQEVDLGVMTHTRKSGPAPAVTASTQRGPEEGDGSVSYVEHVEPELLGKLDQVRAIMATVVA